MGSKLGGCVRAGLLLLAIVLCAGGARAEDLLLPTFRSYAGAFLVGDKHNFFVESQVDLPILRFEKWTLSYSHQDATPFLDLENQVQASLLYTRDELQLELEPVDWLRVFVLGGYRRSAYQDRHDRLSAYVYGAGLGSPRRADEERVQWLLWLGGYADRQGHDGRWWANADAAVLLFDFARDRYLGSKFRASLMLSGTLDAVGADDGFFGLYQVGPEVRFLTANSNRAKLQIRWFYNDDNPFYGFDENGLLAGVQVSSSHEDEYVLHAREVREPGWFPLIWGDYDVGIGTGQLLTRFTMNVETVDLVLFDHRFTQFVWYENRQEYRQGRYDHVNYSVVLGMQTPIGLESPLSQDDPLVAGVGFFHRSDHALDPPPARVAAEGVPSSIGLLLRNGSMNILPRFHLQTLGWDLPYRDPAMYEDRTDWLNQIDWRATAGLAAGSRRRRGAFTGQLGAAWDIATVRGYVPYVLGLGSVGNESPDWLLEAGVRRPAGKVFARWESYGVDHVLSKRPSFVVGCSVSL